jgi:hypothetical protein
MFKHIAILVPAVAKSFLANASKFAERKARLQKTVKVTALSTNAAKND